MFESQKTKQKNRRQNISIDKLPKTETPHFFQFTHDFGGESCSRSVNIGSMVDGSRSTTEFQLPR